MNTARIVVLVIALGAGGVAAYLASSYQNKPAEVAAPAAEPLPTVEILVAKSDIGLGQTVKPEDLQWQTWPANAASGSFIRRDGRPDAATQLAGSIARTPMMQGEPIREQKLVRADGSGFMAAILPTGKRAVSTEISPETGAGGFILPNDHVDVLLTRKLKNPDGINTGGNDLIVSEIVLANIRVLAIDQAPKEKDGQTTVVGRTVTLELRPDQAATLSAARQSGTISLALRSLVDANAGEISLDDQSLKKAAGINVIRYGVAGQQLTSQK